VDPAAPPATLVDLRQPHAWIELATTIGTALRGAALDRSRPVNVVAIGSDRTTGDCLGPLVGDYLRSCPSVRVFGTLDEPVHAANMAGILPTVHGCTIAVDAALGDPVGAVSVRRGALAPGAAFGRSLPSIGDVAVSALVCEAGPLGFERLRSVRLGVVRSMARTIAAAIAHALGDTVVTADTLQIPAQTPDVTVGR
jgi:putative sporulation protein YyaC